MIDEFRAVNDNLENENKVLRETFNKREREINMGLANIDVLTRSVKELEKALTRCQQALLREMKGMK